MKNPCTSVLLRVLNECEAQTGLDHWCNGGGGTRGSAAIMLSWPLFSTRSFHRKWKELRAIPDPIWR